MSEEIKSPTFPESVADGTIANWVKKEGEAVSQDEVIAEIETDKVVLEVLAPSDGKISKIHKNEGDTVLSAELIGEFISGDSEEQKTQAVKEEKPTEIVPDLESSQDHLVDKKSGPAAKRIIEEKELNPSEIKGSGKDGRITKADVISHVEKDPVIEESVKKTNVDLDRETKRVPMTRLRSTIAKRLVEVQQETAMLTTFNEVDMKPIKDIRSKYGDDFLKEHGVKLGFMGFFVAASVNALEKFPQVNASIDGTDIVYHGYKDIGVAVSTDRGLVVPVIKDADIKSISEIEKSISEYAEKARDGKLSIEEMQGGTFTVSNGGIFGSLLSTPILNAPQTAILGMHKIEDRPVVVDGEIVVRPMMYLAMSYDHRMLDGKEAVSFLVSIKEQLENPEKLLLNL
ncbi:2-oxoglutarate dehydrogenase complex dihydrolipoyllysine-residue succinyltransferase [Pseudomonadota bacterium]|nr:2-oxoglutarate dehydrogenase complex dihydrolipoyllysine-residue succinyltransferase [Pseudomonadota bacterium]